MLYLFLLFFAANPATLKEQEEQWRKDHEASMREDQSWLNVVGLFWLRPGENEFGSDSLAHIVLPKFSSVDKAGVFNYKDGKVHYKMNRGQLAKVDGEIRNQGELKLGEMMAYNHLRLFLIQRGDRLGLRVRDLRAKEFVSFQKLDFYRPKKKYLVQAQFEAFEPAKTMMINTVINSEIELIVPGVLRFEMDGQTFELLPTQETDQEEKLFIMVRDQTSGTTTYSGGRFLYANLPDENGKVTLNFNRIINPPCAYTDYATCPLPPAENWLNLAIEAGERTYPRGEP